MRRALVVFGSKNGGTAGLARMVGGELSRNGWTVIVQDAAAQEPSPSGRAGERKIQVETRPLLPVVAPRANLTFMVGGVP